MYFGTIEQGVVWHRCVWMVYEPIGCRLVTVNCSVMGPQSIDLPKTWDNELNVVTTDQSEHLKMLPKTFVCSFLQTVYVRSF